MHERRKHPRYSIAVPVHGGLVDGRGHIQGFTANTVNVGLEGMAIATYEGDETAPPVPFILWQNQSVTLELHLPTEAHALRVTGRIRWYEIGSLGDTVHYFIAGISLGDLRAEERDKWEQFVAETARITQSPDV
jgi:hypothetical protein